MQADQIDTPNESEAPAPDRATMTHALRELEAARARVERGARQVHDATRSELVAALLPVLDNLDRTIRAAEDDGESPTLLEGTHLVRAQLERVLRGYGVERIDALGELFDPNVHDAIQLAFARDPAADGRVVHQLEPGYRFGDRLLRPAKVVVGRAGRVSSAG